MAKDWKRFPDFVPTQKKKYDNLLKHFIRYSNSVLIETGTHLGNGTWTALKAGFEQVYSIEIQPELYYEACKVFEEEIKESKVFLYKGDSKELLNIILKKIEKPATFWLDAHLSKNYGEKLSDNCPIIKELNIIKNHDIKTHTILIDDLNCFGAKAHDYITIEEVQNKILEINENYTFTFVDSDKTKNIMVANI